MNKDIFRARPNVLGEKTLNIKIPNQLSYIGVGWRIDSTSIVILLDDPNSMKSAPLRILGGLLTPAIVGIGLSHAGDSIQQDEIQESSLALAQSFRSVSGLQTTNLTQIVLEQLHPKICSDGRCVNEDEAQLHLTIKPTVYLAGDPTKLRLVFNIWSGVLDQEKFWNNKSVITIWSQSDPFPIETWAENDWKLLSRKLEKSITESVSMTQFIINEGEEKNLRRVLNGREIEYYRFQDNIYFIKIFNRETGKKILYEEQMFERQRYWDFCRSHQ